MKWEVKGRGEQSLVHLDLTQETRYDVLVGEP